MDYNLLMGKKIVKKSKKNSNFATSITERKYLKKNPIVIGVDEVGRGALAGPIHVGATAFLSGYEIDFFRALEKYKIKDSKQLSPTYREDFFSRIHANSTACVVTFTDVKIINNKGIVYAFQHAVRQAVDSLRKKLQTQLPFFLLIDGFKVPYIRGVSLSRQENLIKGDRQCVSIAAASIIAKVTRDAYMTELAHSFKVYQWDKNKGYGTRDHIDAIKKYGRSIHHRDLYLRHIL